MIGKKVVTAMRYIEQPAEVHLEAGSDAPLNVTFIRAPSSALLKVEVPLVFRGEDISRGLKKSITTGFLEFIQ
ncbi:hypothetical protein FXO38_01924 [Capsicum annuum]|nr:hypothetical protein FXO38_01924 [Capsicum annuum]